ncbi:MAG: PP2C family protein-serine/threonine phosphatase, partial [Bdellovibrionia bacterium]
TATVALLDNLTSTLYIANVGDSPAILYDGAIKELSRNHFPVKDEKKRIKKLGGVIYGGRVGGKLAITRSLGDLDLKWKGDAHLPGPSGRSEIESIDLTRYMVSPLPYVAIRTLKSKPMQFLIIAADGIIGTSALQAKEAVKIVKKELGAGRSAKQAADALLEYARIVPKNRDDKSVIIIVFGDTQLSQSHLARHYELRENVSAGDVNYFNYDDYLKNPTLR